MLLILQKSGIFAAELSKKIMTDMDRFKVSIEKQEDGSYIAYNTNVDGYTLLGKGSTATEARTDFANSMKEVAEIERMRLGEISAVFKNEPEYRFV